MKTVHGWAFPDVDDFMAKEMKADGTYQASHLLIAMGFVTDRRCAIDGGGHVGTWSRLMADLFDRVIAVEPSSDTFEALSANMRAFECLNVECLNVALGARAGFVTMVLDGRQLALANTGGRYATKGGTIPCAAIDDWHLPSLGLLKLDIEGSEPLALEGAAETITRCRPIVLFENKGFWKRYGLTPDAPQRILTSLGYRLLAPAGCDVVWGPA